MSVKQMNPFGKQPKKKKELWQKGFSNPFKKIKGLKDEDPWKKPKGKKNPWKW